jgi:hypothetical protein
VSNSERMQVGCKIVRKDKRDSQVSDVWKALILKVLDVVGAIGLEPMTSCV